MTEKLYTTIGNEQREYTSDEYAQHEKDETQAKKDAAAKAKIDRDNADKRQLILDRLGITADELQTLLG